MKLETIKFRQLQYLQQFSKIQAQNNKKDKTINIQNKSKRLKLQQPKIVKRKYKSN